MKRHIRATDLRIELIEDKKAAEQALRIEEQKLIECEKEVKVLEKHKEMNKEAWKEEEKAIENKQMSEIAVQKFFERTRREKEELEELESQEEE